MKQRRIFLPAIIFAVSLISNSLLLAQQGSKTQVRSLNVKILSTMLAEDGIGEWGFSALVEVDGRQFLFDAGRYPDTVLKNARTLGIDLSGVTEVILSHHHGDHTGGLLTLREELSKDNQAVFSKVHVAKGIFDSRRTRSSSDEQNSILAIKEKYEKTGGVFIEHDKPTELMPGVWLTGPVTRIHRERNWDRGRERKSENGWVTDDIFESQSLVINTSKGLVILSGCGHAGIINTIEYARKTVADKPAYAVLGGFHLLSADDEHLKWTAKKLNELGVEHFLGAHCTGIEAVYQIREHAGFLRSNSVVAAVGASFDIESGINPLNLAR